MTTRVSAFDHDIPEAASDEPVAAGRRFSIERVMQSMRNFATLSEALRILGAGVILASMSVFLLQGWSEGNDISRYLLLLTQTGLLGAAGFVMSHLVRETRGARFFFGLALISIPANFTILSALIYSVFQWDGGLTTYPGFADWRLEDVASVGMTIAGALVVLAPVTLFCFAVMARQSARRLTLHFLLLNGLLLLPVRASLGAGMVALSGALYALWAIGRQVRRDPGLKTGEGRFALATLLLPAGIVAFRSMLFYDVGSLMIAMVALVLYLSARQASLFPHGNRSIGFALDVVSWPLAVVVSIALTDAFSPGMPDGLVIPFLVTVYTALNIDLMRRTSATLLAKTLGGLISIVVGLGFTLNVLFEPNAMSALFAIGGGVLLLIWGSHASRPLAVVAGLIATAAGALFGIDAIVELVVTSNWIGLATFGAAAIAAGSVLDRHGAAIRLKLTEWYGRAARDKEAMALDD